MDLVKYSKKKTIFFGYVLKKIKNFRIKRISNFSNNLNSNVNMEIYFFYYKCIMYIR